MQTFIITIAVIATLIIFWQISKAGGFVNKIRKKEQ